MACGVSLNLCIICLIYFGICFLEFILGYTTATGVMSAVLLDPNENASVDNLMGDSDAGYQFKILMYSNPRYRKHMEFIMPWLYDRGALDV